MEYRPNDSPEGTGYQAKRFRFRFQPIDPGRIDLQFPGTGIFMTRRADRVGIL